MIGIQRIQSFKQFAWLYVSDLFDQIWKKQ